MANEQQAEAYNKRELAKVAKAFSLMGDEAVDEARNAAGSLAAFALSEIRSAAATRTQGQKAVSRIAQGAKVSKSSKTGRIDLGFASQRFSGGGSTQKLWGGFEFGSSIRPRKDGTIRRLNQFPTYSGRFGGGSRGWFIYPTLRKIQPELTKKWEEVANSIIKKWTA
jgi:hypothetical protein